MSRYMAVSLTERQVRDRTKTVTRRLGWLFLEPGDRLTLVRKSMGRKRRDGTVEPLVKIVDVEVVSTVRVALASILPSDCAAEGFPEMTVDQFVAFFCRTHKGCTPTTEVTRIEWTYLE